LRKGTILKKKQGAMCTVIFSTQKINSKILKKISKKSGMRRKDAAFKL
jgi:predicted RNA binding protein YcfA (HicA-like mRNA interferase family)